ncbi:MAG: hypothetical protein IKU08_00795 [Clostridia bacterium]|nr:hypothetical protein [Clostridia bacterium]
MNHNLTISISKEPKRNAIVSCKSVSVREKILRFLLGDLRRVTILVPGNSVSEVSIQEVGIGGNRYVT